MSDKQPPKPACLDTSVMENTIKTTTIPVVIEEKKQVPETFAKIVDEAKIPVIQTEDSAGADICSLNTVHLEAGRAAKIRTGIKLNKKLPKGMFMVMEMRSGLRFNKSLTQLGIGIIDGDYMGEITGLIFNPGPQDQKIMAGERFAQLIFLESHTAKFCEAIPQERGDGGFGSTGTLA
jgi:deoxyuridine 5'-triphosphate nucleotidohydrolase